MFDWLKNFLRPARRQEKLDDLYRDAQLEDAERMRDQLRERGDEAVRILQERHQRNHWAESVKTMIQGAP